MNNSTLFDTAYQRRKWALLERLLERLVPIYTSEEVAALRIDAVDRDILSQRSGRGLSTATCWKRFWATCSNASPLVRTMPWGRGTKTRRSTRPSARLPTSSTR